MTDPSRTAALERAVEAIEAIEAIEALEALKPAERKAAKRKAAKRGASVDVKRDAELDDLRRRAHAAVLEYFHEFVDAPEDPVERDAELDALDERVKPAQAALRVSLENVTAMEEQRRAARADLACDGYESAFWFDDTYLDEAVAAARAPGWLPLAQRPRRGLRAILADVRGGPFGRLVFERSLYQARFEHDGVPIDVAGARRLVAGLADAWRQGLLVPNCAIETSLERVDARAYDTAVHVRRLDAVIARTVERDRPAPLALADWPARSRAAALAPRRSPRDDEKRGAPRRPRLEPVALVERDALILVALATLSACGLPPQRSDGGSDTPSGADGRRLRAGRCRVSVGPGVRR